MVALGRRSALPAASPTAAAATCGDLLGWEHRTRVVSAGISSAARGVDAGSVHKCERYGTLGHKAALCRAPNAISGACRTCAEYGQISRQCRIARRHAHVIAAARTPCTGLLQLSRRERWWKLRRRFGKNWKRTRRK